MHPACHAPEPGASAKGRGLTKDEKQLHDLAQLHHGFSINRVLIKLDPGNGGRSASEIRNRTDLRHVRVNRHQDKMYRTWITSSRSRSVVTPRELCSSTVKRQSDVACGVDHAVRPHHGRGDWKTAMAWAASSWRAHSTRATRSRCASAEIAAYLLDVHANNAVDFIGCF